MKNLQPFGQQLCFGLFLPFFLLKFYHITQISNKIVFFYTNFKFIKWELGDHLVWSSFIVFVYFMLLKYLYYLCVKVAYIDDIFGKIVF